MQTRIPRGGVGGDDFDVIFFSKFRYFLDITRLGDYEFRLGCFRLFFDLRRSVERVGCGNSYAAVRRAEEGEHEFGRIVEQEHDDIALSDAEVVEAGGDFASDELDIGVGVGVAGGAIDDAGTRAELGYVFEAICVEWQVIWDVDVWKFGSEDEFLFLFLVLH